MGDTSRLRLGALVWGLAGAVIAVSGLVRDDASGPLRVVVGSLVALGAAIVFVVRRAAGSRRE